MSYIDPVVYDPTKLVGDDRLVMDGFEVCERAVSDACTEYIDMVNTDNPETLGKMFSEIAESIRDYVLADLQATKLSLSCTLMERDAETYGEDGDAALPPV